ncbi:TIGR03557 family F420-dependent LLM class oxidoreductase [Demequina capsici]|uniref:TIGR03557 family F420-dependent LLM class oxidoreductase n=1 Tax=Demequina capsici TaxID=3075620 RepID=A0AA96FEP0_9MICO|nr:TIGR03557 family F420-dependent LLM class oxidoreductase [Demequina sp. PMTSA13]WNM27065.1 TIGR03557 family F420-dependent LLM class oxidoreductase [Demequina sp. PMTSA13]
MTIGYSAMLAQLAPREAVELSAHAESRGFSGVMAADHFQPWTPTQGQAPFVWNVLSVIGEHTRGDLGPGVTTPTFRWHPAMVAQASATLAALHPGRHWLGLGSGEAINEHIVGEYWPEPPERINRMFEALEIIRKLFDSSLAGRDTRYTGTYYKLESTRLWTMPDVPPPIMVAAAGPVAARRAGRSADGLITVGAPAARLEQLLTSFAKGAREGGKDPDSRPKALQLHLSWAPTRDQALANALTEWPNGAMRFPHGDIRSPYEIEQMTRLVRPEDFTDRVLISEDLDVHRREIQRHLDMGFDRIYLHQVGRNQREFIDAFGAEVLPRLSR